MNEDDQNDTLKQEEWRRIYRLGYIRGHADGWYAMKAAMEEVINDADFQSDLGKDLNVLRDDVVDDEIVNTEDMAEAISAGIQRADRGWR